MIDYRDCIVPVRQFARREIYVWVAYSSKPPYLPIACEKTPEELARKIGVSVWTLWSCWGNYRRGKTKHSRYHRVKVGADL